MNEKQKLFKNQLQLAGLGVVIGVFGLIEKNTPCIVIGACIFLYGLFRLLFFKKLFNKIEKDDSNV